MSGSDGLPQPGRASASALRRRQIVALGIAAGVIVAVIAVVGPLGGGGADEAHGTDPSSTALASVEEGALTRQVYEAGTLGYASRPDGSPYAVVNRATGAYTSLPSAGDVIGCGDVLYRVEAEPVVLLCGATPAYRVLSLGMRGPDVRVLNRNLVELGYAAEDETDPGSNTFDASTATALSELQGDVGLEATGALDPSGFAFLPGPLRLTNVSATLGASAQPGEPVAQATSTEREVVVELSASQRAGVEVGDRARITLPDNSTTRGAVTRIGAVPSSPADGEDGSGGQGSGAGGDGIPVYITLNQPRDARGFDEAPVRVEITTGRVQGALSVPVTALVAQAGGGYAVEVERDDGARDLVPVEIGMFDQANGLVEIRDSGLSAGDQVVVPAS